MYLAHKKWARLVTARFVKRHPIVKRRLLTGRALHGGDTPRRSRGRELGVAEGGGWGGGRVHPPAIKDIHQNRIKSSFVISSIFTAGR